MSDETKIDMRASQSFIDEINAKVGIPVVITGGRSIESDRVGLLFFINVQPHKWIEITEFRPTSQLTGLISDLCLHHFGTLPAFSYNRTTFWLYPNGNADDD